MTNNSKNFIYALHNVIQKNKPLVLDWDSKKNGFLVTDIQKFVQTVLPMQFGKNKLESFVRKLNRYGFKRLKLSQNKMKFSHKYFEYQGKNLQKITLKKQEFIPKHIKLRMMRQQLQKKQNNHGSQQNSTIKLEQQYSSNQQSFDNFIQNKYKTNTTHLHTQISQLPSQSHPQVKCQLIKLQSNTQLIKFQQSEILSATRYLNVKNIQRQDHTVFCQFEQIKKQFGYFKGGKVEESGQYLCLYPGGCVIYPPQNLYYKQKYAIINNDKIINNGINVNNDSINNINIHTNTNADKNGQQEWNGPLINVKNQDQNFNNINFHVRVSPDCQLRQQQ